LVPSMWTILWNKSASIKYAEFLIHSSWNMFKSLSFTHVTDSGSRKSVHRVACPDQFNWYPHKKLEPETDEQDMWRELTGIHRMSYGVLVFIDPEIYREFAETLNSSCKNFEKSKICSR
jgi:hypothetical protein